MHTVHAAVISPRARSRRAVWTTGEQCAYARTQSAGGLPGASISYCSRHRVPVDAFRGWPPRSRWSSCSCSRHRSQREDGDVKRARPRVADAVLRGRPGPCPRYRPQPACWKFVADRHPHASRLAWRRPADGPARRSACPRRGRTDSLDNVGLMTFRVHIATTPPKKRPNHVKRRALFPPFMR